ncbi:MAG: iron ABC transporter permease [Victivallales bacterium]|nr:iron ABC transporter permease [Victivallales bacterium]
MTFVLKKGLIICPLALILTVMATASLFAGHYPATFSELLSVITSTGKSDSENTQMLSSIIFELRLPRIFAAILVGAALSASGAAYQSMFVNPLVSPGVLGVLSGGGVGAAIGIICGLSPFGIQLSTFGGGMTAVLGALFIALIYRGDRLLLLVLGGVISGAFFTSILSLIKYAADPNDQLPAITYWLMGSLSGVGLNDIKTVLPLFIIGLLVLLSAGKALNVLSLGEESKALGINPQRLRLMMIAAATLLSITSVSIAGIIGWVGLIVPHIGRMLVGPDNRILLPVSAILGGIILLLADNLSRTAFTVEIPLGITTSIFGIPMFVCFLRKSKGM